MGITPLGSWGGLLYCHKACVWGFDELKMLCEGGGWKGMGLLHCAFCGSLGIEGKKRLGRDEDVLLDNSGS